MITETKLRNFGPIRSLDWQGIGKINLVIGKNGEGKSMLLKALYCALKTLGDYKRGNNQASLGSLLKDKLYWTFQPKKKIGDLVTKNAASELMFNIKIDNDYFCYNFGKDTVSQIQSIENHVPIQEPKSIFLPAKEVLSLYEAIIQTRDHDKIFGFDDTYLDLVRALQKPTMKGNFPHSIVEARERLSVMLDGKIQYDDKSKVWLFRNAERQMFPMGTTAEGIKKISILDILLGNRYLTPGSVVFIDEPESALHPGAISKFMEIIYLLSKAEIQFIMASHSYFVIKKLYILAQQHGISIPVMSINNEQNEVNDLADGMPENPIVEESVKLYEEEIESVLD